MVELLESRLERLENNIVERVKNAFKVEHVNPKENWELMPYLKYGLADRVAEKIGNPSFNSVLYSTLNKDILKRVYYGILSTQNLPSDYLNLLTDWEKVYLFRGRWSERKPDLADSIDVLTINNIYLGLNKLHEDHYVRKANGEYKTEPKFPESDRIREDYKRIISRLNAPKKNIGPPVQLKMKL